MTSNVVTWAALVGVCLPPFAGLLQKDGWSSLVNSIVFGASCIGAAFVVAYLDQSDFSWATWRTSLLTIIGAGLALYKLYWSPSGAVAVARATGPIK